MSQEDEELAIRKKEKMLMSLSSLLHTQIKGGHTVQSKHPVSGNPF